jgi:ribosome biogenesis GTPase / thiamine phosphate phosphatase
LIDVCTVDPALLALGFRSAFSQELQIFREQGGNPELVPARIIADQGVAYTVQGSQGPERAVLAGRLRDTLNAEERPTVGDWVLTQRFAEVSRIEHRLNRATVLTRKMAGDTSHGQTIAANVDIAFIVSAFSPAQVSAHAQRRSLNLRRIERYLQVATLAQLRCVVILNKADLDTDGASLTDEERALLSDLDVLWVSAHTGQGLADVSSRLVVGQTAVLIGSSGVGKSSLTNRLLGREAQRTSEIRAEDARGRHTTTSRDLFSLPSGGLLIDTPGMRELGLWADQDADLAASGIARLDDLAAQCRFPDCRHGAEPGCAVRVAIAEGAFDEAQLLHFTKLRYEVEKQGKRQEALARREASKPPRALLKSQKRMERGKR